MCLKLIQLNEGVQTRLHADEKAAGSLEQERLKEPPGREKNCQVGLKRCGTYKA